MGERTQLLVNVVDEKSNRLIGYYILEVNITICQNRNDKFIHEWGVTSAIMLVTPHYIFLHAGVLSVANFNDPKIYEEYRRNYYTAYLNGFRLWAREEYFFDKEGRYFAHNQTGKTIVTGHTPTCFVSGHFDDGRKLDSTPKSYCVVRKIQYDS